MANSQEKQKILHELENMLPTLHQYELSEVDVTAPAPIEQTNHFFNLALALFKMLNEEEKKRCPIELMRTFHQFEKTGIHIHREDRSQQGISLKVPQWTLTLEIGGQKFGVYTLGRTFVAEIKKVLL